LLSILLIGRGAQVIAGSTYNPSEQPKLPTADDQSETSAPFVPAGVEQNEGSSHALAAAGVALSPGYSQHADPGKVITYTHILTNTGVTTDTFAIDALSAQNWPVALIHDSRPGATPSLSMTLSTGLTTTLWVSLTVPRVAISGTLETTMLAATSQADPATYAVVTDTTTVSHVPGVALAPNHVGSALPGTVIIYTHTLTNTGNGPDAFTLNVSSSPSWTVQLLGATGPYGTLSLPLGPGLTRTVQVSISVPARVLSGTLNIITGTKNVTIITATSQTDPAVFATATDTTTARSDIYTIFMPLIQREDRPPLKLAVDFGHIITDTELLQLDVPLAKEMGAGWVRVFLPWRDIEESPGFYNWTQYDAIFERLSEQGLEPLPTFYAAPDWAAPESCGPISDTLAFEGFLQVMLGRYGTYADAWEFTNEPDGRSPGPWGPVGGCWGLHPEAYADQLGIFYNQVKAWDPGALVVFGGLAYDNFEQENIVRSFFTETLRHGAGQYFDVANVHFYPINIIEFPTMAHKINEIKGIMDRHGVRRKKIWITETGMWVNSPYGSVEQQRDFIVREFTRGFAAGVDNLFWFDVREHPTAEGRVHRWLISDDHQPINGYRTFQNYADKIEGMTSPTPYQNVPPDVEAYRFFTPGRSLYILWSNTVTQTVAIPASTSAILTDRDGDTSRVVPVQSGQVFFEVGTRPIFIEISPTALTDSQP
jgi:hypothetical protein